MQLSVMQRLVVEVWLKAPQSPGCTNGYLTPSGAGEGKTARYDADHQVKENMDTSIIIACVQLWHDRTIVFVTYSKHHLVSRC